jgi:hypothetical protein
VVIDVLFAFYLAAILELFYFLLCAHSSPIISHRLSIRAGAAITVPPLVMEMQTGSTNNHLSQIYFVFAAPIYSIGGIWLAAPVLMMLYKGI